ncbi:MAG: hypothetical protein U5K72_02440 [Balneolaceae bacterium]|nr:hypothetical protein [Balneolaceae bacterium]
MKSEIQIIKIKLDVPDSVIEYFQREQQWENEGGAIPRNEEAELEHDIQVPLKPGISYFVMDGRLDIDGDHLYYIADIHQDKQG